jgi:chromosome partitioning protein
LGEGVNLPGLGGKRSVTVYGIEEWTDSKTPEDIKMVICDCSPSFEANPVELVKKFDYCIIPTTLNPLGLNKNGHVIKNTLEQIRSVNKTAELFVLVNNYQGAARSLSKIL